MSVWLAAFVRFVTLAVMRVVGLPLLSLVPGSCEAAIWGASRGWDRDFRAASLNRLWVADIS